MAVDRSRAVAATGGTVLLARSGRVDRGPSGPVGLRHARGVSAVVTVALSAVALGWIAGNSSHQLVVVLLAAVAVAAVACLSFGRSAWCAAAVVALAVFGWTPAIAAIGPFDIRTIDVVTALLVIRTLAQRPRSPSPLCLHRLAVFVCVMGVSVLAVGLRGGSGFTDSGVSWFRLAATASLAWLVPAVVRSKRDLRSILGAFGLAGVATVVQAAATFGGADRASSLLGPNSLGLVAGLLLVMSRYSPIPAHRTFRIVLAVSGITGLLLSKSIGSTAATGAAFVVAGAIGSRARIRAGAPPLRVGIRLLIAGSLLIAFVSVLRPADRPGSSGFSHSSTAIRLSVGYAGLHLFVTHPLAGVGWQESGRPGVINDPSLIAAVKEKFPGIRGYENLKGANSITSVHNMYVQILAEGGIIGFGVFLWLLAGVVTGVRTLFSRMEDPWLFDTARFLSIALVFVLVWWNDNPLFGGQVESILVFVFLGLLAALPRLASPEVAS